MPGLKPVEVVTMAGLSDGPMHGYGLVERISELTEGRMRVRPGNLYRVLNRLESAGLVVETEEDGDGTELDRRRNFRLTTLGRQTVAAELVMYAAVLDRAPKLRQAGGDV